MKTFPVLYAISFLSFSKASKESDSFIKVLQNQLQAALFTTPSCVVKYCPQVTSVSCPTQPSVLQFVTKIAESAGQCQSNANGICGAPINHINILNLVLKLNDSSDVTCYGNNNDSYFLNVDKVKVTVKDNGVNERGTIRRWYNMTWNDVQYNGKFCCYKLGCNNRYLQSCNTPTFNLQIQIRINASALSSLSIFQNICLDDNTIKWVLYNNAVATVKSTSSSSNAKTLANDLTNSLKRNYFGYTLGMQFTYLVGNALIERLYSCNGGSHSIC